AWSPDGEFFGTAGGRGGTVWDPRTGEAITPWLSDTATFGPQVQCSFCPYARRVVICGAGNPVATVWELPRDNRSAAEWIALAEAITGERVNPETGLDTLAPAVVQARWREARSSSPDLFHVTKDRALACRRRQTGDAA